MLINGFHLCLPCPVSSYVTGKIISSKIGPYPVIKVTLSNEEDGIAYTLGKYIEDIDI